MTQASPILFGEVLFDRFPDGAVVLGGAPFNVAWHLQAFGQSPLFISRVGDDPLGRRIIETMHRHGMDVTGLQRDPIHPTGTVEVGFVGGEPRYDIVSGRAYDFVDHTAVPYCPEPALLYHGSLALRNNVSREALEAIRAQTGVPVFLDVNLRRPWWRSKVVHGLIAQARWVKLNEEELALLVPQGDGLVSRVRRLLADHDVEWVVVSRGAKGALFFAANGYQDSVRPGTQHPVLDSVGAGDAFSSVLILGLLRRWSLRDTLSRAQAFASALVGVRGATVSDAAFYRPFIEQWEMV
jgi:fructokinase